MHTIFADSALLPQGWQSNVAITIDDNGTIVKVEVDQLCQHHDYQYPNAVIPGIPNIHSHAFQRAMAGLAETTNSGREDFWIWRDVMYRFANKIDPESLFDIASQLYLEMLKAGYTSVAEFHYLHGPVEHLPGHNNQLLSLALIEAAKCTGIRLTLLPTLYQHAGFDKSPLRCDQKRFYNSLQDYLLLCEKLNREVTDIPTAIIGVAFHSLRAVASDTFVDVMGYVEQQRKTIPIHIHISEQTKELEECINHYNQRPLDWLIDNQPVNEDWCLVHATHANSIELRKIISSGATVGLCPITEANLGDGIFPLKQFIDLGGKFAIGSDSNIGIDPFEELRWLEYGQRLKLQKRIIAVTKNTRSNGQCLIENVLEGGRHALGQPVGQIAPGYQADLLLINSNSPALYGKGKEDLLNSLVFTNSSAAVDSVMVAGQWVVSHWHHFHEEIIEERFKNTMNRIIRQ